MMLVVGRRLSSSPCGLFHALIYHPYAMMPVLLRESNPRKQDRSDNVLMTQSQKSHTFISTKPHCLQRLVLFSLERNYTETCECQEASHWGPEQGGWLPCLCMKRHDEMVSKKGHMFLKSANLELKSNPSSTLVSSANTKPLWVCFSINRLIIPSS